MAQNLSTQADYMNRSDLENTSWKYSADIRISFTILFTVVVVVGTCGNSLVIVAVKLRKVGQTCTNFLLANLAVADFTTLLSAIPDAVVLFVVRSHPDGTIGTVLCKFVTFGTVSLITSVASVLILLLISWERYRAIAKPLRLDTGFKLTEKNITYVIGVVWSVAFIYGLPLIITTNYTEKEGGCAWEMSEGHKTAYTSLFLVFFYALPLCALCYSYWGIVKALYTANGANLPGGVTRRDDMRAKFKVVKTLIIVTVVFLVCLGIFSSFWLMFRHNQISDTTFRVSVCFLFLNATVNPLIYTWQSASYRHAFKQLVKNCCRFN